MKFDSLNTLYQQSQQYCLDSMFFFAHTVHVFTIFQPLDEETSFRDKQECTSHQSCEPCSADEQHSEGTDGTNVALGGCTSQADVDCLQNELDCDIVTEECIVNPMENIWTCDTGLDAGSTEEATNNKDGGNAHCIPHCYSKSCVSEESVSTSGFLAYDAITDMSAEENVNTSKGWNSHGSLSIVDDEMHNYDSKEEVTTSNDALTEVDGSSLKQQVSTTFSVHAKKHGSKMFQFGPKQESSSCTGSSQQLLEGNECNFQCRRARSPSSKVPSSGLGIWEPLHISKMDRAGIMMTDKFTEESVNTGEDGSSYFSKELHATSENSAVVKANEVASCIRITESPLFETQDNCSKEESIVFETGGSVMRSKSQHVSIPSSGHPENQSKVSVPEQENIVASSQQLPKGNEFNFHCRRAHSETLSDKLVSLKPLHLTKVELLHSAGLLMTNSSIAESVNASEDDLCEFTKELNCAVAISEQAARPEILSASCNVEVKEVVPTGVKSVSISCEDEACASRRSDDSHCSNVVVTDIVGFQNQHVPASAGHTENSRFKVMQLVSRPKDAEKCGDLLFSSHRDKSGRYSDSVTAVASSIITRQHFIVTPNASNITDDSVFVMKSDPLRSDSPLCELRCENDGSMQHVSTSSKSFQKERQILITMQTSFKDLDEVAPRIESLSLSERKVAVTSTLPESICSGQVGALTLLSGLFNPPSALCNRSVLIGTYSSESSKSSERKVSAISPVSEAIVAGVGYPTTLVCKPFLLSLQYQTLLINYCAGKNEVVLNTMEQDIRSAYFSQITPKVAEYIPRGGAHSKCCEIGLSTQNPSHVTTREVLQTTGILITSTCIPSINTSHDNKALVSPPTHNVITTNNRTPYLQRIRACNLPSEAMREGKVFQSTGLLLTSNCVQVTGDTDERTKEREVFASMCLYSRHQKTILLNGRSF